MLYVFQAEQQNIADKSDKMKIIAWQRNQLYQLDPFQLGLLYYKLTENMQ